MFTVKEIHNDFNTACDYKFDSSITPQRLREAGLPVQAKVLYFQERLKTYKIITASAANDLCKKYSLVAGELGKFTGHIPTKNLIELEQFRKTVSIYQTWSYGESFYGELYFFTKEEAVEYVTKNSKAGWLGNLKNRLSDIEHQKGHFFIVAPQKDMLSDKANEWMGGSPPDPIILWSMKSFANDVYAITTGWGDEAADEIVVNENNN